jgi:hypothetical protein
MQSSMTVVLERDHAGRSLVTLRCDGCPRTATTDMFTLEHFCALIGWQCPDDEQLCTLCQWHRGITPSFARRSASHS